MKRLSLFLCLLCLFAAAATPASALEYTVDGAPSAEFAQSTSVEPEITADKGETPNSDLSKNNPTVAPAFGSNTSYLPGSGEPLYPFLSVTGNAQQMGSSTSAVQTPPSTGPSSETNPPNGWGGSTEPQFNSPAYGYTEVTRDLYYSGNYLGRVSIPRLGVNVKLYEGTDSAALAKGAGHFTDTSIWNGNVCVAGHNRGVNCYFGNIHTLTVGDKISLTTKLGVRTYSVVSVQKVLETDRSMLTPTTDNRITLFTCVRNQSAYRWCVQAVEVR